MRERDDEAKAPTHQITGHKDMLFSSDLDESVTNAIEIRQMQQAEFVVAVYRKCSRHQGVPPGDEVGASHPCEATCEQADDPGEATIQFHSCVRGGVHCWRRRRNVGSSELQDIMTKYNEVSFEMVELVNLMGQAAQGQHSGEVRHESRRAHDHELPGA